MRQNTKGAALITGASSGIGAIYANRLANRGYDLILVARNQQRLEIFAAQIAQKTGRKIDVLATDLTNLAGVARIEQVLRTNPHITMLVNNAGGGATAPLLGCDGDKMSQMIALNVDVLTRLTYAAAPAFVARAAGTIINIASIVAVGPDILNGMYRGAKAFVLAFSQSLKRELTGKGVRVQVVLPGATATDFWGVAGTPVEHLPAEIDMPACEIVDAALAGLDQGEFVTQPSPPELNDRKGIEAMASHAIQRANIGTLPDCLRLEWLEAVLEGSGRLGTAVELDERLQRSSSRGGLPGYKLRRVLQFIDAHLDQPIDVEQLAAAASLSLFHFHRQFKRATGSTPHQYIVETRIERAKALLADSELPLVEVAAQVGFADQSHFGSTFRKVTSMTPRGFRNAMSI